MSNAQNPVLVNVTRGGVVESSHRGVVMITGPEGEILLSLGDVERATFPRSSVKLIQSLMLVESGAADAFNLSDPMLALSCSSHNGEAQHRTLAARMLGQIGLTADHLACGAHLPELGEDRRRLARMGRSPDRLFNACSGKHAGFLTLCHHEGWAYEGYETYDHPLQSRIRDVMESLTGAAHAHAQCGADGCSIPTYAVPLRALAAAWHKLTTARGLEPSRANAAKRLMNAAMANTFYIGGSKRFDTDIMAAFSGKVWCKFGAEGVYAFMLPAHGISGVIKCDDGSLRGAEAMMAGVLAQLFSAWDHDALMRYSQAPIRDWNGTQVGATEALREPLATLHPVTS